MDVWKKPSTAPCSHTFCSECIVEQMRHSSTCPICKRELKKRELTEMQLFTNLVTEFNILSQKVRDALNVPPETFPQPSVSTGPQFTSEELEKMYPDAPKPQKDSDQSTGDESSSRSDASRRRLKRRRAESLPGTSASASTDVLRRHSDPAFVVSDSDKENDYYSSKPKRRRQRRKQKETPRTAVTTVYESDPDTDSLTNILSQIEKKRNSVEMVDNVLREISVNGTGNLSFDKYPILEVALNAFQPAPDGSSSEKKITYVAKAEHQSPKRKRQEELPEEEPTSDNKEKIQQPKRRRTSYTNSESNNIQNEPVVRVFCSTGLAAVDSKKLDLLARKLGARTTKNVSPNVTHMIAGTDGNNISKRTLKFATAVICGAWIVNFDWVNECLEQDRFVDELPFEIKGDTFASGAPALGRIAKHNQAPPLFAQLNFCFVGRFNDGKHPPKKELLNLCKWGGAVILDSMPTEKDLDGVLRTKSNTVIIVDKLQTKEDIQKIYNKSKLKPVTFTWLLDCASHYSILPFDAHYAKS